MHVCYFIATFIPYFSRLLLEWYGLTFFVLCLFGRCFFYRLFGGSEAKEGEYVFDILFEGAYLGSSLMNTVARGWWNSCICFYQLHKLVYQ